MYESLLHRSPHIAPDHIRVAADDFTPGSIALRVKPDTYTAWAIIDAARAERQRIEDGYDYDDDTLVRNGAADLLGETARHLHHAGEGDVVLDALETRMVLNGLALLGTTADSVDPIEAQHRDMQGLRALDVHIEIATQARLLGLSMPEPAI